MLCKIQSDTLTAIANQTRRLTGTSASLSPAQMATALSGVSLGGGVSPGGGGEPCDYFKFCDFNAHPTDYGDNGTDGNGNALTPYTVLDYLPKYSISPPSTSITLDANDHIPILDKFANLIPGQTISNNRDILAEISMPSCTAIPDEMFAYPYQGNLAVANFPACVSVGRSAFYTCESLETLTLNSGCVLEDYVFLFTLAPDDKIFRLYLRGNSVGTCSELIFGSLDKTESDYDSNLDTYFETGVIPGLEIYVPANLLNDFKTTWAGGVFANNIYALTD